MLYKNVKQTFCTSAGDDRGTSKYFVYENGIIRAKTAVNELHIRPGKNICFVSENDSEAILKSKVKDIKVLESETINITTSDDNIINALKTHDATHNCPIDFFKDMSGLHPGHKIVGKFDSGVTKITESEIDDQIKKYVDTSNNKITGNNENKSIK